MLGILSLAMASVAMILVCPSASAQNGPIQVSRWAVRGGPYPMTQELIHCFPLQYFLGSSKSFEYNTDLTAEQNNEIKDSVESHRIGLIDRFQIYEVTHAIQYRENAPSPTFIKMIVAERNPGDFCEIYNDQGMAAELNELTQPYFVDVDSERVLVSRDQINGSCGCFREAYWTFDKDGPIDLDFGPVRDAEKRLVPPGFSPGRGGFDIQTLTYTSDYFASAVSNRVEGTLRMTFVLRDHKLVVLTQEFDR